MDNTADVVIFTGAISNIKDGGCYFNKFSDYFAFERKDGTVIIETSSMRMFPKPRCVPKIYYHDIVFLEAYLANKFRAIKTGDIETIESFLEYLDRHFPVSLDRQIARNIRPILRSLSGSLGIFHDFYHMIFDRCRPKLILLEDGCYGPNSLILKWAKRNGIVTAEPQHGQIYENHYAYNYGMNILESKEYRQHFPDYLLTYGSYWNAKTNIPSEKVVIGNPHHEEQLKRLDRSAPRFPDKKVILIASSSNDPAAVCRFAISLTEIADRQRYQILFRPHPSEKPVLRERYGGILASGRILLDQEPNIYKSLSEAHTLVSEPSTIVYEALGICRRIYILDVPSAGFYFPKPPFPKIHHADEIFPDPSGPSGQGEETVPAVDSVWEAGWKSRYRGFVDSIETGSGQPGVK